MSAAPFVYNLDVTAGLPSNHIYGVLVDRHGYLWAATPEGIGRYNGYEVKLFDVSDGLPTSDIWELFEDAKGRIWLLSFAQSLGYIHNDRYSNAYIPDSSLRVIPSARTIDNYDNGIFLLNEPQLPQDYGLLLVERDDTFRICKNDFNGYNVIKQSPDSTDRWLLTWKRKGKMQLVIWQRRPQQDMPRIRKRTLDYYSKPWVFHHYLLFNLPAGYILAYDVHGNTWKKIRPHPYAGSMRIIPGYRKMLYLLTDKELYQLSDTLGLVRRWPVGKAGLLPESLSWVTEGAPWDVCFGTAGKGVYIACRRRKILRVIPDDMSEYRNVGHALNGNHYWWSDRLHQLAMIDPATGRISYRKSTPQIKRILPWNKQQSLVVVVADGLYMLDHETGNMKSFLPWTDLQIWPDNEYISVADLARQEHMLLKDTSEIFMLSRMYGLSRIDLQRKYVDPVMQRLGLKPSGTAYKDIVYDPCSGAIWAYGNAGAIIYNRHTKNGEKIVQLRHDLLKGIDQVLVDDRYGNVFVRKANDLFMIDRRTGIVTVLGGYISMTKSRMCLRDSLLVVAGRFGTAFFRVDGPHRVSGPVLYEQVKNEYYDNVINAQLVGKTLFMHTNNGFITAPVPDSTDFLVPAPPPGKMRLIAKDLAGIRPVSSGDTLFLDPELRRLDFDVVNPVGNGKPGYSYRLVETGEQWQRTGHNELVMPSLTPGNHYTLRVQVSDYVCRQHALLHIYIVPHWWQTVWAKRAIVFVGLLVLLFLAWLTVWITKRIMIRENFKKNLRMEIELKSIYAQINPHFIYNSLNSILLFIRSGNTSDASCNVSKFSKLLRAYIKSSRNRYITVGEEIENLQNYIELQQVRFNGKFSYRIRVEDPGNDITEVRIPSLLVQPLVENAINHGLFHKEERGNLDILFQRGGSNEVICVIEDDGIGRRASGKINKKNTLNTESYGSLLIEDLISVLNRYEQADIEIEYIDKQEPLTGTIVKLYIR